MIVKESLTNPIKEWVLNKKNRDLFFYKPYPNAFNVCGLPHTELHNEKRFNANFPYKQLFEIYQSILIYLKLPLLQELDKEFGALISFSEVGHQVHAHTDPNPPGKIHTRFNVLLSKPEKGGEAVIDNKIISTQENELWVCAAGKYTHSSIKVEGKKPRILLSYGTYLTQNELDRILILKK